MLVPVRECGGGVNKDLLPSELKPGVWSDTLNMRGSNGFAQKRGGIVARYTTPTATPYWIGVYNINAETRYLIQAGTATVFADDGSTRTEITPLTPPTGARDDRWTGGDFNGILVLNNGVDAPYYWTGDTGDDLADLTDWPANYVAGVLRPFKNYLVAGYIDNGTTTNAQMVMWSNAAEAGALPTEWVAASDNDAGDDPFSDVGAIVDFLPLGDLNIVYGERGRVEMQYVGGSQVFNFRRLPGNDGLLAKGCAVSTPSGHVFLSNGDVMLHNGGDAISIADGIVRKWLFDTMDSANASRSFVCLNPKASEVWIVFPSSGSDDCDTVAAWNWKDKTWAIHSVPSLTYGTSGLTSTALSSDTWATDDGTWEDWAVPWSATEAGSNTAQMILATTDPLIGIGETGALDFGESIAWHLEKKGIHFDDPDSIKVLNRSRPQLSGVAGAVVMVKHAATMTADASPVFGTETSFTLGTSNWANQFSSGGRYMAIRFEGSDDQPVAMRSYDLEFTKRGRY